MMTTTRDDELSETAQLLGSRYTPTEDELRDFFSPLLDEDDEQGYVTVESWGFVDGQFCCIEQSKEIVL
jgi:hypothetical protein